MNSLTDYIYKDRQTARQTGCQTDWQTDKYSHSQSYLSQYSRDIKINRKTERGRHGIDKSEDILTSISLNINPFLGCACFLHTTIYKKLPKLSIFLWAEAIVWKILNLFSEFLDGHHLYMNLCVSVCLCVCLSVCPQKWFGSIGWLES